ncbi:MAG: Gfo/Idh/MocA family oxidoreductase, partial [Anaerolineae bacterium]
SMDNVRLGIIGVGAIGSTHLKNAAALKRATVTAVCDVVPRRARTATAEHGCRAYLNAGEMLRDGVCDAVVIATPHYDHVPLGIAALDTGHHVLVEKPIAVHKTAGQRLIAAHERHPDLAFAAMFQMRTQPHFQRIKRLVDGGELGDLLRVNWIVSDWFRTQAYYDSGGWRATWAGEGGGVLTNQAPHNLDLLQWICGMPERVWAACSLGKRHRIEVEDEVTAYLAYPGGGTGVFVTSTGETPGTNRLEIAGERGKLVLEEGMMTFTRNQLPAGEFLRTSPERFARPATDTEVTPAEGRSGLHAEVLRNFAAAILDGEPLIAPAAEGIHSVELANAMLYSSLTGQPVDLPLDGAAFERELQKLVATSTYVKPEIREVEGDVERSFH